MVAVALASLALLPPIPPEPTVGPEPPDPSPNTYIVAGPAEGSTVTSRTASFKFASDDPLNYLCTLDSVNVACGESYTTPTLALGKHTLLVRSRGSGGWDFTPAVRNWNIAAAPTPTATPTPVPPVPEPTPAPEPSPAPATPAFTPGPGITAPPTDVLAAPLPRIDVSIVYFMNAKRSATRFTTLSVKKVPAGSTVKVTCRGGCPRKSQTLRSAKGGTVALSSFRRKALKTGAKLTIAVTKPGMTGMVKILTMRRERRPAIVTRSAP